jgi:hypothetical protein
MGRGCGFRGSASSLPPRGASDAMPGFSITRLITGGVQGSGALEPVAAPPESSYLMHFLFSLCAVWICGVCGFFPVSFAFFVPSASCFLFWDGDATTDLGVGGGGPRENVLLHKSYG